MKRKVLILKSARDDLLAAFDFIATDNVKAADRIVEEILSSIERLAEWPGTGHVRQDVQDGRYRFWFVKPYVIAYRHTKRTLTVVRVLHGARNFRQIL